MKTGIVRCGYAPLTISGAGVPTYGTPVYFADAAAGAREYSAEQKGDVHAVWANSKLVYQGAKNSGYDINLTLIDFIDDVATAWYGDVSATMGSASGKAEPAKVVERPHFALILSEETTDGVGKTTVFFNCCAGKKPSIAGKTTENGDWDDQFPEYSITSASVTDPATEKSWVKMEISGTEELQAVTLPTISA